MTIGLAVAGLGWLGESLIRDVPRGNGLGLEVVAVQDVVPRRAADIATRYAIEGAFVDFDALLEYGGVDALVVCTPNALHAAQAQAALRAGKHVLVQKPLALSAADAEATLDAARRADRVVFVDYTYRFLDTMRTFRQQLPGLGPIESMSATFHNIYGPGAEKAWFFDPRLSGGGALTDLGVHLLDLGLWLSRPARVLLEVAQLVGEGPVEHAAHVRLQLDGVPFNVDVSWNAALPATDIALVVNARGGRLSWQNVAGSFFHFQTRLGGRVIADRETTLRADTLRTFAASLGSGCAPEVDTRVYALLDQAYRRALVSPARPAER